MTLAKQHLENQLTVPGKILFYGGYSVLEKGHCSLSIAVSDKQGKGVTARWRTGERRMISRQFGIDLEPGIEGIRERGILVEFPYIVAELYLNEKNLLRNRTTIELENSPAFGNKKEKTGLGSSAAATVAVVKALFSANGLDPLEQQNSETIHKLSQYSYALFAKKICSGFDIATSVIGKSIIYRRYCPTSIGLPERISENELKKNLMESIGREWKGLGIHEFRMPERYSILFFNIEGTRTETISCVKAVNRWKEKHPGKYSQLIKQQNSAELKAIQAIRDCDDHEIRKQTHSARKAHMELQDEIAKDQEPKLLDFTPIEPDELTKTIQEAEKITGIVAGRAPGAGGWDGLAFICTSEAGKHAIQKIIQIGKKNRVELKHIELKLE